MLLINKERILEMDVIRAMAILGVIGIHISATTLRYNPYPTTYNITFILNQICRFSVPAFIFISGMGITISYNRKENYFYFLWKRCKKVLPQYLVWCLIYIIAITKNYNIHQNIDYIIHGKVFYHLYFIPLIIELYLIFPIIYRFIENIWFVILSFGVTAVMIIYTYYFINVTPDMWFFDKKNLLYWIFYFCIGGYIGKHKDTILPKLKNYSFIIFGCLIISMLYVLDSLIFYKGIGKNLEYLVTFQRPSIIIYSTLFILFIFSFNWKNKLFMGIIKYISKASYSVYLCHALILYLYTQYYISNGYSLNSLHFELKAFLITFFGALIINELKKFL